MPTFADRGYLVVSVTDPYGRILQFLGRNYYYYFILDYEINVTTAQNLFGRGTRHISYNNFQLWLQSC
jgi:hypothetical protein